jgi:hypothetical protein
MDQKNNDIIKALNKIADLIENYTILKFNLMRCTKCHETRRKITFKLKHHPNGTSLELCESCHDGNDIYY